MIQKSWRSWHLVQVALLAGSSPAVPMPALAQSAALPSGAPIQARVEIDASTAVGPLKPVWRFFGADEPNYATMKDGEALLSELGALRPRDTFFRAHNLLNTGDGTAAFKWGSTNIYNEDAAGHPVYNWTVVDRIIDTYLARGVRPYLQLGFMPEALSTAPAGEQYRHGWRPGFPYELIAGRWNAPPRDYRKWAELIYQWTLHNVRRYGRREVEGWYFETWNEPNGASYWRGSEEEFEKLHDYAVDAVRRALPTARVGGPEVAGSGSTWLDAYLAHVARGTNYATGRKGTPTDFLSFHAKGRPVFTDGHVRMGLAKHLDTVAHGFRRIAAVPELAGKPIVIGESDPEGCAACPGPQNGYRNGTMYASYTAESLARIWELAEREKVNLEGVLTWSFTFEDQPWFAGYRQLATNGVDLPVMNVFRLFAKLGDTRVAARSDHQLPLGDVVTRGVTGMPDIGTIATRASDGRIQVLLWNYHDDDVPGPSAAITLDVRGLGASGMRRVVEWRVDGTHANAYSAWRAMGAPPSPNDKQYAMLKAASHLVAEPARSTAIHAGRTSVDVVVPRQGVTLVTFDPF